MPNVNSYPCGVVLTYQFLRIPYSVDKQRQQFEVKMPLSTKIHMNRSQTDKK